MKISILFTLFCLLAGLANGQTAPEGTSLRNTILKNKDQEAKAIVDRSNTNTKANKQVISANKPIRESLFTNYKPGGNTQRAFARKATVAPKPLASDKPAQPKRDSSVTKIVIPDQGGVTPKTKN